MSTGRVAGATAAPKLAAMAPKASAAGAADGGAGEPRIYADFEPASEWQPDLLKIFLPGFKRADLRVLVDSHGNMRVLGERQVAGTDRWVRFRKDLRIPDGCDTAAIHAKFDNETLQVAFPKQEKPPAAPAAAIAPSDQANSGADNTKPTTAPAAYQANSGADTTKPAPDAWKDTREEFSDTAKRSEEGNAAAAAQASEAAAPPANRRLLLYTAVLAMIAILMYIFFRRSIVAADEAAAAASCCHSAAKLCRGL